MYSYFPNNNAAFASDETPHSWQFASEGKINGGLAVVGNALYFESFAHDLVALDRRSGHLLWRARLPNVAMTTPIVAGGLVVVGTGKNEVAVDTGQLLVWGQPGGDEVAAFDARTGAFRWRYRTVGEDMPSPALVRVNGRDAIVFANGDDHARALDARTGRLLWSTRLDGVSTMASAVASAGIVYVLAGVAAGMHRPDHVYAIRARDGRIVWEAPYGNADVSPAVADGRVFISDAQRLRAPADRNTVNDVFALDARTGALLWERTSAAGFLTNVGTNEEAIAGMVDRVTFFVSLPAARRFSAFSASDGRVLWSVATMAAVKMSAVALDGKIYAGDTAGVLYTIAEGSGRVLSRRRFARPFTCSSPVVVGRTLYIANDDRVFALSI